MSAKKSYRQKFEEYAPEFKQALAWMDKDFLDDLESDDASSAAFAVCDAFTEFWAGWHGGGGSRLYALGSNFCHVFKYAHRASEVNEPGSSARDFYACLCKAFGVDDPIRKEVFGEGGDQPAPPKA